MIRIFIRVLLLILLMIFVITYINAKNSTSKHLSEAENFEEAIELAKIHGIKFEILNMEATSYAYVDERGEKIANDYTKSGNDFLPGFSIAVDPDQISFGSVLYIEGYGWGKAADTGDNITWGRIDVSYYSVNDSDIWGVKYVKVINFGQNFSSDQINNLKKAKLTK